MISPIAIVLSEDVYETSFGDGFYAYVSAAFFTRPEAEAFIEKQLAIPRAHGETGYPFHLRDGWLLERDDRSEYVELELQPFERAEPSVVLAALGRPLQKS